MLSLPKLGLTYGDELYFYVSARDNAGHASRTDSYLVQWQDTALADSPADMGMGVKVAPAYFRSWRIRDLVAKNADNHPLSVELLPNSDHVFRGPAYERFTPNELYVTRRRPCEVFASQNPGNNCGRDLAGFTNGESLAGRDLVVWYGTSFHHLPRDEDEDHMHPHWSGFSIIPRDLTA